MGLIAGSGGLTLRRRLQPRAAVRAALGRGRLGCCRRAERLENCSNCWPRPAVSNRRHRPGRQFGRADRERSQASRPRFRGAGRTDFRADVAERLEGARRLWFLTRVLDANRLPTRLKTLMNLSAAQQVTVKPGSLGDFA